MDCVYSRVERIFLVHAYLGSHVTAAMHLSIGISSYLDYAYNIHPIDMTSQRCRVLNSFKDRTSLNRKSREGEEDADRLNATKNKTHLLISRSPEPRNQLPVKAAVFFQMLGSCPSLPHCFRRRNATRMIFSLEKMTASIIYLTQPT